MDLFYNTSIYYYILHKNYDTIARQVLKYYKLENIEKDTEQNTNENESQIDKKQKKDFKNFIILFLVLWILFLIIPT